MGCQPLWRQEFASGSLTHQWGRCLPRPFNLGLILTRPEDIPEDVLKKFLRTFLRTVYLKLYFLAWANCRCSITSLW